GLAFQNNGGIYIADTGRPIGGGAGNGTLRRIGVDGRVRNIFGSFSEIPLNPSEGEDARSAYIYDIKDIAYSPQGELYLMLLDQKIRKLDNQGILRTAVSAPEQLLRAMTFAADGSLYYVSNSGTLYRYTSESGSV